MQSVSPLPDDVLRQIERLARSLNRSRSELLREAAAGYLRRARTAVMEALDGAARASVVVPPP